MRIIVEADEEHRIQDGRIVPEAAKSHTIEGVQAYQLTALKQNEKGKMDYHHASILSIQDHVRAEILSLDTLKVKAAKVMGEADNPHYQKFYKLLADWALSQQKLLEGMNIEMNKIALKEARAAAPDPNQN